MKFKVNMNCYSCTIKIEKALKKLNVKCENNFVFKTTKIISNPNNRTKKEIMSAIKRVGYEAKSL